MPEETKKNRLTELEAHNKLKYMWERALVIRDFTEGHSGYKMALKRLMEFGYLDVEYLFECYYNS